MHHVWIKPWKVIWLLKEMIPGTIKKRALINRLGRSVYVIIKHASIKNVSAFDFYLILLMRIIYQDYCYITFKPYMKIKKVLKIASISEYF